MLVLTRRAGESIVIGDDVRVVVLDVRGETIRLGIEAPRSVQVHRAEVYAEVQAANAAAARAASDEAAETATPIEPTRDCAREVAQGAAGQSRGSARPSPAARELAAKPTPPRQRPTIDHDGATGPAPRQVRLDPEVPAEA